MRPLDHGTMTLHRIYMAGLSALSLSRNRLILWCGAIVIGIVAAGYAHIADLAQRAFAAFVDYNPLLPLLVCPLVFGGPRLFALFRGWRHPAMSRLVCPVSLYHALASGFIELARRPAPAMKDPAPQAE